MRCDDVSQAGIRPQHVVPRGRRATLVRPAIEREVRHEPRGIDEARRPRSLDDVWREEGGHREDDILAAILGIARTHTPSISPVALDAMNRRAGDRAIA